MPMLPRICEIITEERYRFEGETLANALRCAAWFVKDEFPEAKASDFGHAAVACGLHRQGAINRWNEAMKNLEIANGR